MAKGQVIQVLCFLDWLFKKIERKEKKDEQEGENLIQVTKFC